jgi:hypothetical protein
LDDGDFEMEGICDGLRFRSGFKATEGYFVEYWQTDQVGVFLKSGYELVIGKGKAMVMGIIKLDHSSQTSFCNIYFEKAKQVSMIFAKVFR